MCLQEEGKEIKQVNNAVAISKKELNKPHESWAFKTCARQLLFSHVTTNYSWSPRRHGSLLFETMTVWQKLKWERLKSKG